MADDWLALRALWDEVAEPDRAAALAYFQLPPPVLFDFDRADLVDAYQWSASPDLYFDFENGRYFQRGRPDSISSLISVSRASTGYAQDTAGNWTSFGNNTARITNRGLLVEEARTNSIRNNSMQGAVAGVIGSGGALPTNWSIGGGTGLTFTVSNITTVQGIDIFDLRIAGTSGGIFTNLSYDSTSAIPAANGQIWTLGQFVSIIAGGLTNISSVLNIIRQLDSGSNFLSQVSGGSLNGLLSSALTRRQAALTTNHASTAFIQPAFSLVYSSGVAVDVTFRIGWPQLELGAFATSPIRTTSAAETRAADVVTVAPPALGSAYTLFAKGTPNAPATYGISQQFLLLDDGSANNRAALSRAITTGNALAQSISGGVSTLMNSGVSWVTGVSGRIASGFAEGDNATCFNGASAVTSAASLPIGVNVARLGSNSGGGALSNGYIERAALWPNTRLPNADLQRITAP